MTKPSSLLFPALPEPPPAARQRLRHDQQRGDEPQRSRIDDDSERTTIEGEHAAVVADSPELRVGSSLAVSRELTIQGSKRLLEERFAMKERLSSEGNTAGDVFRAARYWDGQFYGDVVLKKPKSSLRASPAEYSRACRELERERHCLFRFDRHPSLLAPAGPPFHWDGELVLQTHYLPWSIGEYLSYFNDESSLTHALAGIACQSLSAIEHLAQIRDQGGPAGYAHVDLKVSHLRMDYRERGASDGDWVVVIIDLDSVLPIGPVRLTEAKYNRACVDPEKFMSLHDHSLLSTVDPTETVYALGLTLLRVLADGLGVLMEKRRVQPTGFAVGSQGKTVAVDADAAVQEIERARAVDHRNFSAVYWQNRERRLSAGQEDVALSLEALLDKEVETAELVPTGSPSSWSVEPDFFLALHECLLPRSERMDPRRLCALFARMMR